MKTVPLHGAKAAGRVALVDDGDYALVMRHRWYVQEKIRVGPRGPRQYGPYAVANVPRAQGRGQIFMHKLITGYRLTDHRNHNGLDNQRYNLRDATVAQNGANQRPRTGGTSAYKGVSWSSQYSKWIVVLAVNKKRRYVGVFASEEEAARAYDAAALEAFGDYAYTNFPEVA